MPENLTADLILFTIQSALKLGGTVQRAYANSLKSKKIILPLPDFNTIPDVNQIHIFFSDPDPKAGGAQFLEYFPQLIELDKNFRRLDANQKGQYEQFYLKLKPLTLAEEEALSAGKLGQESAGPQALAGLLAIRQWEEGKAPDLTPLQLIAGTVVRIGIDYFSQAQAPFFRDNAMGRSIKFFLAGFDDIRLESKEDFKNLSEEFVPRLFISATEVLGGLSDTITGDQKFQSFIQSATRQIAGDIYERLRKANLDNTGAPGVDREEVVRWGEVILSSVVRNAGEELLANPSGLLGTNQGASALIQSTGNILLGAVLDSRSDKIDLKKAFTHQTLDSLVQASFKVFAEHPRLISGKQGIKEIIAGVSLSVEQSLAAQVDPVALPTLVPELVRLILEHTAGRLDLLWKVDEQGGEHLLLLAVQQFLAALAQPPVAGKWRPQLTGPQIIGIANRLLEKVATEPGWILAKVEGKPMLGEVLDSVFRALRGIPAAERLTVETVETVIQVSLRAVVTSQKVLARVKFSVGNGQVAPVEETKTILNHALDLVFASTFNRAEIPPAGRTEKLIALVDYVLEVIVTYSPGEDRGLVLLQLALFDEGAVNFAGGFNRQLADDIIRSGLQVLATRPDLISRQAGLQNVVRDLAVSLRDNGYQQPGLLAEMLRLVLESTGRNAALIIPSEDPTRPRYLLVQAMQEILAALSQKAGQEPWRPRLTGTQLVGLAEDLIGILVTFPGWLVPRPSGKTLLREVLEAVVESLRKIPQGQRVSPPTLQILTRTIVFSLVTRQNGGDQDAKALVAKVLDLILTALFVPGKSTPPDWEKRWVDIAQYLLETIVARNPNAKGLLLAELIVQQSGIGEAENPFNKESADQLARAALVVIERNTALVTANPVLQSLIQGLSQTLQANKRPDLIPAVLRYGLEFSAGRLEVLTDMKDGKPVSLLTLALQQVFRALAAPEVPATQWRFRLQGDQLLGIIRTVLQRVAEQPQLAGGGESLRVVMEAVVQSLQNAPAGSRITYETIHAVVDAALKAATFNKQWVLQATDGTRLAIRYTLDNLVIELYKTQDNTAAGWTLTQAPVFHAIVDALLVGLSTRPLTKVAIDEALNKIRRAAQDLKDNLGFSLKELLAALENRKEPGQGIPRPV